MLKRPITPALLACLFCGLAAGLVAAQTPAPVVNGATNFCRLDPNFASGGATTAEAFATLKEQGFKTVINLRTASEPGSDIPGETETATKLGLRYVSLPFSTTAPDVAVVDKFLVVMKDPANQPIYIHCQGGTRANAFWMIKRVLVDGWTTEKALAEADSLKMTNQALRKFALAYIEDHK
jgi:tyrosine-protein phosphatase SIW14